MSETKLYQALTYAGAIPFLACAVAPYVGMHSLGPFGEWQDILVLYGVAIASFLAGTHWAFGLGEPRGKGSTVLVVSNAIVLAVWIAALVATFPVALGVQFLAFVVLLFIDRSVATAGKTTAGYFRMRLRITAIVLAALIIGISATWLA